MLAYHGCDKGIKDFVLYDRGMLEPSTNNYDWLGSGIYFWEQNAQRALGFAQKAALGWSGKGAKITSKPIKNPAVLGAVIDLGYCMNLMDMRHIEKLVYGYELLKEYTSLNRTEMPKNSGGIDMPLRRLDKAVIEMVCKRQIIDGMDEYDTVRGLFQEGPPVYQDSGFMRETHIQICVRNPSCIIAYFDPRE